MDLDAWIGLTLFSLFILAVVFIYVHIVRSLARDEEYWRNKK